MQDRRLFGWALSVREGCGMRHMRQRPLWDCGCCYVGGSTDIHKDAAFSSIFFSEDFLLDASSRSTFDLERSRHYCLHTHSLFRLSNQSFLLATRLRNLSLSLSLSLSRLNCNNFTWSACKEACSLYASSAFSAWFALGRVL